MPTGSPYTYVGNANPQDNTGAILTSQGTVLLGGWGYFTLTEYQACISNGYLLVPGQSGAAPGPTRGGQAYSGTDGTVGGPGGTSLSPAIIIGSPAPSGIQQTAAGGPVQSIN